MRDTELYQQILGLSAPWSVARVALDVKEQRVDVYAEHGKKKTWPCPECGKECGLHDHDEERMWRHLDSCQFQTFLHARIPRVRCDDHGVKQVRVPIVADLDGPKGPCVLDLAEGRTKEALVRCFGRFSMRELEDGVDVVAMDMSGPYISVVQSLIGGEKIVFDRFHIMMHMNEAVDRVRRRENRDLRTDGDNTLVGSKHIWLYGRENVPDRYAEQFAELRNANLRTARAWAIKEMLRDLWDRPSEPAAKRWYARWRGWATRSRLDPVRKVAAMIHRHLPNVLSYFINAVTNAASEAINSHHPDDQEACVRLQELSELPRRGALPLRRPRPLPAIREPPECLKSESSRSCRDR